MNGMIFKDEVSAQEANSFLFAAAGLLIDDGEAKDLLYDCVQEARFKGDWKKVTQLTIKFLGEYQRLGELRGA